MIEIRKAVVMARGLGTRMRRAAEAAELDPAQARVADTGLKAMIPVGRPFLDYVLSGLADAGFAEAILVIGPEHDVVRRRYTDDVVPTRLRVAFAVQAEPRGTADAVLAARPYTADEPFAVLNGDNYYSVAALDAVRRAGEPAVALFTPAGLSQDGNIPIERIRAFAIVTLRDDGCVAALIEKPETVPAGTGGREPLVSMNLWALPPTVFDACATVSPSPRGEYELPSAMAYAIAHDGLCVRGILMQGGVLDLSNRSDIAAVTERLRGVQVRL